VALLVTNVALFWYTATIDDEVLATERGVRRLATAWSIVAALDTVIVLATWLLVRREVPARPAPAGKAARTWLLAPLILAGLLGVNVLYHLGLMELADVEPDSDVVLASGHHTVWLLALFCIQPALIEELFFRRLALDFFLPYTTPGSAVYASAAMFAAVHTGALISFPVLLVVGAVLGWVRLRTGSLVLPVTLHFLHNLAISLHELTFP
jgi:membrane protease YdiL (CAAX protease family)